MFSAFSVPLWEIIRWQDRSGGDGINLDNWCELEGEGTSSGGEGGFGGRVDQPAGLGTECAPVEDIDHMSW